MKIKKTLISVSLILMVFLILGSVSAINPESNNTISSNTYSNINNSSSNNNFLSEQKLIQSNNDNLSFEGNNNGKNLTLSQKDNEILSNPEIDGNYYVDSVKGSVYNDGSKSSPLKTIGQAMFLVNLGSLSSYTVNIAPGIYTENSIIIQKNITFTKTPNMSGEVIINGNQSQIFKTEYSAVYFINFNELTITNAHTNDNGAVIYVITKGIINISNCNIENNKADKNGGAIYLYNGTLTCDNSIFTNNTANVGGVIGINLGNLNCDNCIFIKNNASLGGAISITGSNGNITNRNTKFLDNTAGTGGAIYKTDENIINLNTSFINNRVKYKGGAISLGGFGNILNTDSTFISNTANMGGAIEFGMGTINNTNTNFTDNSAVNGGAIHMECVDTWTVTRSEPNNIINTNTSYINNKATNNGGAINIKSIEFKREGYGDLIDLDSVYINNTATNNGGAIYIFNANINCRYCVLLDNSATIGKAVYIENKNNYKMDYNWWGNNTPFAVNDDSNNLIYMSNYYVTPNYWVIMYIFTPSNVSVGETSYFNVKFRASSIGGSVKDFDGDLPSRELNLKCNGGTIDPTNFSIVKSANSFYTAGNIAGDYNITATIDYQTSVIPIKIISNEPIINNTTDSNIQCSYNDSDKFLSFNLTSNGIPLVNQIILVNIINGLGFKLHTDDEGLASVSLQNYDAGNYNVKFNYDGNSTVNGFNGSINITVTKTNITNSTISTVLKLNNFNELVGAGKNLTGTLLDVNGNPVSGQHISLLLSRLSDGASKVYWATTDDKGEYQLEINLAKGLYAAIASFEGNNKYNSSGPLLANITVKTGDLITTSLTANKFSEPYGAGDNFTGKLLNHETGAPIVGQHIALKLTRLSDGASKVYWATTDTKGEYQLAINLYTGEYTAQCSYGGTSIYQASNAGNTISVTA